MTVLVGSLVLLGVVVVLGFMHFSQASTPLWLVVLAALAMLGVGVGFAGFFLMMVLAGWKSFREARRVQVIPPDRQRVGD